MTFTHDTEVPERRPHNPINGPNLQHCRFTDCRALYEALTRLQEVAQGYVNQPRLRLGATGLTTVGQFLDDLAIWLDSERDRLMEEVKHRVGVQHAPSLAEVAFLLRCDLEVTAAEDLPRLLAEAATMTAKLARKTA